MVRINYNTSDRVVDFQNDTQCAGICITRSPMDAFFAFFLSFVYNWFALCKLYLPSPSVDLAVEAIRAHIVLIALMQKVCGCKPSAPDSGSPYNMLIFHAGKNRYNARSFISPARHPSTSAGSAHSARSTRHSIDIVRTKEELSQLRSINPPPVVVHSTYSNS